MSSNTSLLVVFGNQLFDVRHLPPPSDADVFMAEDLGLCTYVRHHQQKIVLFLAAMRAYADELRASGYRVHYRQLDMASDSSYEDTMKACIDGGGYSRLVHFEIEDKPMEDRVIEFASTNGLDRAEIRSPMFICSRHEFQSFASGRSRLVMAEFYKAQRLRMNVLVDAEGRPDGGRWSFDTENRKKLPRSVEPPAPHWPAHAEHVAPVVDLVREYFAHHPGDAGEFRWPTTRAQARAWLDDFLENRLDQFGPYEDAMTTRSTIVFHSALTPMLNLGLLTPHEIVERAIEQKDRIPLASLEGFVRQVIGWREFVRGIYREFGEQQEQQNFWSHERELTDAWYEGNTGIPPLDDTIRTALRLGWTHHIPRLMVAANLMTLCEIRPAAAHRWFMEMYVDSSEWVMGPNVFGMGLYSDGGLFATKPYICGSNYIVKMSDYGKGPWCDVVDGLYWRFIDKHRAFFSSNPRLALMPRALDRLSSERRGRIFDAADGFLASMTR